MANTYKNKVVLSDGTVLIDLTGDDVTLNDVAFGKLFHLPTGESVSGTLPNGDNFEYGLTDTTLPMVGVGQVNYAEIGE